MLFFHFFFNLGAWISTSKCGYRYEIWPILAPVVSCLLCFTLNMQEFDQKSATQVCLMFSEIDKCLFENIKGMYVYLIILTGSFVNTTEWHGNRCTKIAKPQVHCIAKNIFKRKSLKDILLLSCNHFLSKIFFMIKWT